MEEPVEQGCGDDRVVKGRNLGQPWDGTKAACAAELGKTGGSSGFPRLHLREDDGRAVGVVGRGCYAGSVSADRSWLMDRARRKAPSGQTTMAVTGHLAQVTTSRPGSRARAVGPDQTIGSVRTQSARSPQYVHKGPIAAIDCRRYNCRSEALLVE